MSNFLRDIAVIVDIDVVIELGLLNLDEIAPALFYRCHHRVVKLLLARLLLVESSLLTHWTAAETTRTVPKDQLIVFLRLLMYCLTLILLTIIALVDFVCQEHGLTQEVKWLYFVGAAFANTRHEIGQVIESLHCAHLSRILAQFSLLEVFFFHHSFFILLELREIHDFLFDDLLICLELHLLFVLLNLRNVVSRQSR